MKIFKRATTNIMRQPGKSMILLFLVFILGTVLAGAISIRGAMITTEESLMMRLPAISTIEFDWESAHANTAEDVLLSTVMGRSQPTREVLHTIGNLPYVRSYDFNFSPMFFSRDLLWSIMEIDEARFPEGENMNTLAWVLDSVGAMGGTLAMFTGRGVANPELTDIEAGLITLTDGRTFTQEEIDRDAPVVVVSEAFARANHLSINSIINLENIAHNYPTMGRQGTGNFAIDRGEEAFWLNHRTLEVQVIGIFDIYREFNYESYEGWLFGAALAERANLYNRIYMPIGVAEDMLNFVNDTYLEHYDEFGATFGEGTQGIIEEIALSSIFILYDPRDLDAFSVAAEDLLADFWGMRDLSATTDHVITSMDIILQLADFVQWVAVATSIIVLTLIIVLFLRERRHEIGIYMALGDKKGRVISQILIEVGLTALVGIIMALFVGNMVSETISRNMLEQHLIEQQVTEEMRSPLAVVPWELVLFNPGELSIEEALEMYHVALDIPTMLRFVGVGSVVILASTVIPIWYVVKLEPKKILM